MDFERLRCLTVTIDGFIRLLYTQGGHFGKETEASQKLQVFSFRSERMKQPENPRLVIALFRTIMPGIESLDTTWMS